MPVLYCQGRGASSGVQGHMPGQMQGQMQGCHRHTAAIHMDGQWKACLPTGTALNMFYLLEDGKITHMLAAGSILQC